LTLYGFANSEEREYFNLLMGVSGVGPRLALVTLSTLNPDAIRRAVDSDESLGKRARSIITENYPFERREKELVGVLEDLNSGT